MSSFAAGALVIGFLVLVGVPILWLILRSGSPNPADQAAANREFTDQLQNPDFAALETQLKSQLPAAVTLLYADRDLLLGQNWHVSLPNPGQRAAESYVAYFQPALPASLRDMGDGRGEWLAFGNDGAGDEYLVDLRKADPPVVYLQHDTGREFELAATLAEFVRLPRRQEGDD
jgi:hypothetical protein